MENTITVNESTLTLIVAMSGEIDHHTSEDIREKVDKAYERTGCRHIIFDFSRVTFMDSSGIGMIIGRYKHTEKRGGILSIAGMNDELSRIYKISGLAKIVKCFASVEEAERSVA